MIENFYRENVVLLQVQVNIGEKETERTIASPEGWKVAQEGLGRWTGAWGAYGGHNKGRRDWVHGQDPRELMGDMMRGRIDWAHGQEAGKPMGDKMKETSNLETINLELGKDPYFLDQKACFTIDE